MSLFSFSILVAIIQLIGILILTGYIIAAVVALIPKCQVAQARLLVAEGVITSLSFIVSAALLRTISLQSWEQILVFSVTLSLRTFLKKLFVWEKVRIRKEGDPIKL